MTKHQVSVAAEAIVASLLAQAGCDVFVQYGANQPGYDLVASRNGKFRKVSVKGNKDGGWMLAVNYMEKGSGNQKKYIKALDAWLSDQDPETMIALVQYKNVELGKTPRVYLASPRETTTHMKTQDNGIGGTTLWEAWTKTKGKSKGFENKIPVEWSFSNNRLNEFI